MIDLLQFAGQIILVIARAVLNGLKGGTMQIFGKYVEFKFARQKLETS